MRNRHSSTGHEPASSTTSGASTLLDGEQALAPALEPLGRTAQLAADAYSHAPPRARPPAPGRQLAPGDFIVFAPIRTGMGGRGGPR